MPSSIDAFMHEYAQRYSARDVDGVTELCHWPFVAIREGEPIHLADRSQVQAHFSAMIDAYGEAGYARFSAVAIDTRPLGELAAFTTVRWHAVNDQGDVVRDSQTTYHLLSDADGWHMLSYTNHF